MKQIWKHEAAPAFAMIVGGELRRLSTELPPFDGETEGLQELSLAARIKAGWYSVTAPAPGYLNPNPASYDVAAVDTKTGVATLELEQDAAPVGAEWAEVRAARERLFDENDKLALRYLIAGKNVPAELKTYAQALRDITASGDPQTKQFPEKPKLTKKPEEA